MAEKQKDPARVILKDVRLSFAHLFKAQAFGDGEGEPKFNCNFLLDPATSAGKSNIKAMEKAIDYVKAEKWPKGAPKLGEAKVCLRDGSNVEYDGYDEMMFVSANNGKKPRVLDRDKCDVQDGEDECPYSGCYVDGIVRVWAQDNKWGKRINASLEAVRFRRDGDAFGAAPVDPDDFDDIDGDEDDNRSSRRGRDKDEDGDREERSSRRSRDKDEDRDDRSSRRSKDKDEDEDRSSRRRAKDEDEDRSSRRRSKDEDEEDRSSRRRSKDDDEDDRGSRRRSKDDDEDDRSSRRSRDKDEDDDRDRPSRNSRSRRSRDDDDVV